MEKTTSKPSTTSRKRQREEESSSAPETDIADQSLSLENNLSFSDTLVALQMMRSQFPRIDKVSIQPFILRSQLYSSVKDRTQVDRELESLKRESVVRIFKLNSGQDDHAIMFVDDYLSQIERAVQRFEEKSQDGLMVFDWFRTHVIPSNLEPSIGHQELFSLLSLAGKVKEEHISLLINAGLLTRQLIDPNMYWFAIPNIGSVLKGLSQVTSKLFRLPVDWLFGLQRIRNWARWREWAKGIRVDLHVMSHVKIWKSQLAERCQEMYAHIGFEELAGDR